MSSNAPRVSVLVRDPAEAERSERLASRLALPLNEPPAKTDFFLGYTDGRLSLFSKENPKSPVSVDWIEWDRALRRTSGYSSKSLLARALGLRKGDGVWDLTAGLGGDTLVLCGLGFRVTAVEQSPVVYELLMDGWSRAKDTLPFLADLRILNLDARDFLRDKANPRPRAIYLDPMYPDKKKSSLPKKEMQILQKLLGPDTQGEDLFREAIKTAGERVVVKRPLDAPELRAPDVSLRPTHSFRGKSVRLDMYAVGTSERKY